MYEGKGRFEWRSAQRSRGSKPSRQGPLGVFTKATGARARCTVLVSASSSAFLRGSGVLNYKDSDLRLLAAQNLASQPFLRSFAYAWHLACLLFRSVARWVSFNRERCKARTMRGGLFIRQAVVLCSCPAARVRWTGSIWSNS